MTLEWTKEDSAAAIAEGWDVFNVDNYLDIQKCDELELFGEDTQAIVHVFWWATAGSELHRKALLVVLEQDAKPPYPVHGLRK